VILRFTLFLGTLYGAKRERRDFWRKCPSIPLFPSISDYKLWQFLMNFGMRVLDTELSNERYLYESGRSIVYNLLKEK